MENSGITESNTVEDGTATVDNQLIINNNKSSEETEPEPGLDNVSAVNQRNAALGSSQDSEPSSEEATASSSEAGDRAATSEASGKGEEGGAPGTEEVDSQAIEQDLSNLDNDINIYHVKWISYCGGVCGVVTQNSNGPCPLISIVNVLSLRGKLSLPQGCEVISAEQLLEYLADLLINIRPDSRNLEQDFHHNMNDAIAILPKLQTGLDVNVRFTSVKDFEYTPECIVFDLVSIGLYHGWLVDPQLEDLCLAIGSMSYNQVVESIITGRTSADPLLVSKALVAEQFLDESASQLTYHGICELNAVMKEGQLAVFFRNNHFSTMVKQGGVLYLLVTDQGFLHQGDVVWESLDSVQGDTVFVDQQFNTVTSAGEAAGAGGQDQDRDHQLAVSLQKQDAEAVARDREWAEFKQRHLGAGQEEAGQLSDEELARRLQQVEISAAEGAAGVAGAARPAAGHNQQLQNPIGPRRNGDKKCTIL